MHRLGRSPELLWATLLAIASLLPLWVALTYSPFLNDDAFITLTYAKNLAAGQGFVYNQGPATLGTTAPLLTFLVAGLAVILPGVEIPTLAVYLTTCCWIGIAWTFFLFRASWSLSAWQAVVVGVVSLASGWVAFLGMETYLFAFLLVLGLSLFFARHYFLAGLATALVVSVHTIVSWDFAVSIVPGWHSTVFPPYFVVGAVFSGLAVVLMLSLLLRGAFIAMDSYALDAVARADIRLKSSRLDPGVILDRLLVEVISSGGTMT